MRLGKRERREMAEKQAARERALRVPVTKGHARSAWDNFSPRGKGPRPSASKDNRSASDVIVYCR